MESNLINTEVEPAQKSYSDQQKAGNQNPTKIIGNNTTLEDYLDFPEIYPASLLLKLTKKGYKSVFWERKGRRPRKQILMLHEVKGIKENLKINSHSFGEDGSLTLQTSLGTLKFS